MHISGYREVVGFQLLRLSHCQAAPGGQPAPSCEEDVKCVKELDTPRSAVQRYPCTSFACKRGQSRQVLFDSPQSPWRQLP